VRIGVLAGFGALSIALAAAALAEAQASDPM
jgi:hypothetical protein